MGSGVLKALGALASGGGSYYGQIAAETSRKSRVLEARAEADRIRLDNRAYSETQYAKKKGDAKESRIEGQQIAQENITFQQDGQEDIRIATEGRKEEANKGKQTHETMYTPEGEAITVRFNMDGQPLNITNEVLDTLSSKSAVSKETDSQRTASYTLTRMSSATNDLKGFVEQGKFDEADLWSQLKAGTKINAIKDPNARKYATAMAEWYRAKLRLESGAVIGVEEALEEAKLYFPSPFDDAETTKYKTGLRDTVEYALFKKMRGTRATQEDFRKEFPNAQPTSAPDDNAAFDEAFSKY